MVRELLGYSHNFFLISFFVSVWLLSGTVAATAAGGVDHVGEAPVSFPPPLASYGDAQMTSLWDILANRVAKAPFNLWASLLFFCAIVHTFLTHRFLHLAHVLERRHMESLQRAALSGRKVNQQQVSPLARVFHFLGEVEAVFGIWAIPLLLLMEVVVGQGAAGNYVNQRVDFTEAVFIVVIMAIASTQPILRLAENSLELLAGLGGKKPAAWWLVILTVGPLLGSFITEPAAMTICASLLVKKFYVLRPGKTLAYATLGLLFTAISVGGTLTHFAAPPVLMVADTWSWNTAFMLWHFGWKATVAILISVAAYYLFFRKELRRLGQLGSNVADAEFDRGAIPLWVTVGHLLFLLFAVIHSHNEPYLIFTLLFFLAFTEVTEDFQRDFSLRPPVLVGFFLAGLVIHGGLQQWWIAPVLSRLGEVPLMLTATALTAFNDNAAITYLTTLVPTFTDGMKYAAVAGAVAGGGLTVIANAPNPAGQSILDKHFEDGVSALGLFLGALAPTIVAWLCFLLLQ